MLVFHGILRCATLGGLLHWSRFGKSCGRYTDTNIAFPTYLSLATLWCWNSNNMETASEGHMLRVTSDAMVGSCLHSHCILSYCG